MEKADHEADAVGAGEFEVGWRRQFRVDFYNFLEEDGDGAHRVPQQHRQIGIRLSLPAQQIKRLHLSIFTSSLFSGSLRFLIYWTMLLSSSCPLASGFCAGS